MRLIHWYLSGLAASILLVSCTGSDKTQVIGAGHRFLPADSMMDSSPKIHCPKVKVTGAENDARLELLDKLTENDGEDRYVLIVDTGISFAGLKSKMKALAKSLNMSSDSARYLDSTSGELVNAGGIEYAPRAEVSKKLSIEYFNVYYDAAPENVYALVGGIFVARASVDSALQVLRKKEKTAFYLPIKVPTQPIH